MKRVKNLLIALIFTSLFIGCNSDDCDNDDTAVLIFNISVKLNSTNGQNLINDTNFDLSLLRILTTEEPIQEIDYFANEVNGINTIRLEFLPQRTLNIEYDGIQKADLSFTNIVSKTDECGNISFVSFTANSNGEIVCDCSANEIINIEFDI